MPKPNYKYEKRQKEIAKQKKKAETKKEVFGAGISKDDVDKIMSEFKF